jgi:hypothetical protein
MDIVAVEVTATLKIVNFLLSEIQIKFALMPRVVY